MYPGMTMPSGLQATNLFEDAVQHIASDLAESQVLGLSMKEDILTVPSHPLEIRPLGNAYASRRNIRTSTGRLSHLSDEALIQVLEHLDAPSLVNLGSTCKALYAFCRHDDLWKTLLIESSRPISSWLGSWLATFRGVSGDKLSSISCNNLFSDVLHRPFVCAHTPLFPYCSNIPTSNQIPKLSDLSAEQFAVTWTDEPFILTGPVKEWPVYSEWSNLQMLQKFGDTVFRAEAVDWSLNTYIEYMNNNEDESPLYLFDRAFVEKMGIKVGKDVHGAYWPPECFGDDLFSVLSHQRPDSRWLIIGPERSGSTFHKDPNATSAWNAVLRGSKYWIMFPSHPESSPPPGVFVSADQSEVTSPLSIAEWLISFHAEARNTPGCREGICSEGEVLHVPSGWWHLVVNLSPSIAITQNFVPEKHLGNVLDFLKNKSDQVSGFSSSILDPYGLFVEKLQQQNPEEFECAKKFLERQQQAKKRKWDAIIHNDDTNVAVAESEGFSFGFGDANDAEVP